MVHINNTKHITIENIYIHPRDSTSMHYKTAYTNIQHCIQYITNIRHSVLAGDVNTHSTLTHSHTDDHRGQLITDVISNSDHITLNTNTNQTTYPSSPQLTYDPTTDYNKTAGRSPTTRKLTGHNSRKTMSPLSLRPTYPPTYTLPTEFLQISY